MSIKEKILSDLESIDNQYFLNQIQIFISLFKSKTTIDKNNKPSLLALAGTLSDDDANSIQKSVDLEFSKIEGEW